MNILTLIAFLLAFQLALFAVFLWTHKKGKIFSNRIFGTVLFLLAISIADFTIRSVGFQFENLGLHLLDETFLMLYGPLLYIYVKSVIYKNYSFHLIQLTHLIPFGLVFLIWVYIIFTLHNNPTVGEENIDEVQNPFIIWVVVIPTIQMLTYLALSQLEINNYRKIIRDNYSSVLKINLEWLQFIIRAFMAIVVVAAIHNLQPVLGNSYWLITTLFLLLIVTFAFIIIVTFRALKQPEIFQGIEEKTSKYATSGISKSETERLASELKLVMQSDKPYLNPNLSLKELSEGLEITPKTLSQVINLEYKQNFFDFINTYRCEEVKSLLDLDKKMTILEALYKAGFNSKSSFNKEFKKLTGQTPSQYRKENPL